ncbi:Hcn3 [Symbiodinium natans]|uniref:Hcn3 protein n=1 Tax=Symbiodinium natans TaxID=878477 RepID=A0A812PBF1_9DINO|nr:Hcn3 [Symbiodinium natans]
MPRAVYPRGKPGESFHDLLRQLAATYERDLQNACRAARPHLSFGRATEDELQARFSAELVRPPTSLSMPTPPLNPPPLEPLQPRAFSAISDLKPSRSQRDADPLLDCFEGNGASGARVESPGTPPCQEQLSSENELFASQILQVELRNCWAEKPPSVRMKSIASVQSDAVLQVAGQQPCTCTLSPSGTFRNTWDLVGVICLAWDVITIPLQMFDFQPEVQAALEWISRLEIFFWLIDMMLAFLTGFVSRGILVMDLPTIRRHYLRNWFSIDLSILVADVLLEFAFVDVIGQMKAAKFLRLVRLLRIIRLGKLTRVSIVLRDQLQSRVACIQLNLSLVILGMILLEHVIACCWHGIGSLDVDNSWLDVHGMRHQHVSFQYATALRWSFAQLGVGGTEIEAVSYTEAVYSVIVAFVSLVSFSTVISSMTSLISSLNKAKVEETDQFWLLRKYLRDNDISGSLAERVTDFLQYAYHTRAIQLAEHPHILQLLSKPLQGELSFRLYRASILRVSFLAEVDRSVAAHREAAFQKLASDAVRVIDTGDLDALFSTNQEAHTSYLLLDGSLRYVHGQAGEQKLRSRSWISEMALWTQWLHVGELLSIGFSRLVCLDVQEFSNSIFSSLDLRNRAHLYAKLYVERLRQERLMSDLWLYEDVQVMERAKTLPEQGGRVWGLGFGF